VSARPCEWSRSDHRGDAGLLDGINIMRMTRVLLTLTLFAPTAANAQYRITRHYVVGGEGSRDYVVPDTANHRLFIGRADRVMVVDENDRRLLCEVQGIHGAHGTAVDLATGRGFVTPGDDSVIGDVRPRYLRRVRQGARRGGRGRHRLRRAVAACSR
jgi:hypothetical protein